MRNENLLFVNGHDAAIRASERSKLQRRLHGTLHIPEIPQRERRWYDWITDRFEFPGGELAIVTSRGDKVSIPTPLIGALLALFMWMVGGTIGFAYFMGRMSSSVDSLNSSFMQYQIRTDSEKKAMQEKIDLQQMYITDLREKQARFEGKKGG